MSLGPWTPATAYRTVSTLGRWWSVRVPAEVAGGRGAASRALAHLAAWFGAAIRVGLGLAAAMAALLDADEPGVVRPLVIGVVLLTLGWLASFAWVALVRGLWWPVVTVDLAWTAVLCAGQGALVGQEALSPGTGWVAATAAASLVVVNLAWRPRAAVPAGGVVLAAYLAGAVAADQVNAGVVQVGMLGVQLAVAAVLMWLVRRAGRAADDALTGYHDAERAAAVDRARRAVEREENLRLHDTVLATLTMVGTGSVETSTEALRRQAHADLAVLTGDRPSTPDPRTGVRLDELLRTVAAEVALEVDLRAPPHVVPAPVGEAFAGACGQALVNVANHARTDRAVVALVSAGGRTTVSIVDSGTGFDPTHVRSHRFGVSEGIVGRMRRAGGDADIDSTPGAGTTVWLRWPR